MSEVPLYQGAFTLRGDSPDPFDPQTNLFVEVALVAESTWGDCDEKAVRETAVRSNETAVRDLGRVRRDSGPQRRRSQGFPFQT